MADVHATQTHEHLGGQDAKQKLTGFDNTMKKYNVAASWSGSHAGLTGSPTAPYGDSRKRSRALESDRHVERACLISKST